MTKAEFIKRLEDQFQGINEGIKRRASAEIEGSRARMDAQAFADWLRLEMHKANAEPALKSFDWVLQPSHSTPKDAAHSLAELIEMDNCCFINHNGKIDFVKSLVDWQDQYNNFASLLSNSHPEKSDGWKYRLAFADYMAAAKATARAGIFAAVIDAGKTYTGKPNTQPASVTPDYAFEDLFAEGAKERFLKAANRAGIINSAGKWALGDRKKWVLVAAWNLAFNADVTTPGLNDFAACKSIAEHWGITISQTTFEGYWSDRRDDNSMKRGFDSYSRFLQDFNMG